MGQKAIIWIILGCCCYLAVTISLFPLLLSGLSDGMAGGGASLPCTGPTLEQSAQCTTITAPFATHQQLKWWYFRYLIWEI